MSLSADITSTQPATNSLDPSPLTVSQIIHSIPGLIDLLSQAKNSIPSPPPTTHNIDQPIATTITNNTATHSSSGDSNNNADANNNGCNSDPVSSPTTTAAASSGNTITTTTQTDSNNKTGNNLNGSVDNNINVTGDESEENYDGSCWILGICEKKHNGGNNSTGNSNTGDDDDSSSRSIKESYQEMHRQLGRLERDLRYIESAFGKLKDLEINVCNQFKEFQEQSEILYRILNRITKVSTSTNLFPDNEFQALRALTKMMTKLKLQIPASQKMSLANAEGHRKLEEMSGMAARNQIDEMLKRHAKVNFQDCVGFLDFEENYNALSLRCKLCLMCFAVFPENVVVKKRLLMYWWVGEGLIDPEFDPDKNKRAEEVVDEILKDFLEKGFIQAVIKKRRLVGFSMHALIRYAVTICAERAGFFNFDLKDSNFSSCQRACLMKAEPRYREVLMKSDPEKLQTLFNINDPYPDLKAEWFSRMRNVKVLCLGRWDSSPKKRTEDEEAKIHIEVEGIEFLNGLKNMKYLRFLSLQGISRINELPDTVSKLSNLRILDLNACHSLEVVPENISSLKKLTHLDVSQCYLVDYMPKELGLLTELEVLKGFVISDLKVKRSGTLNDLEGLTKLRKLSIYTTKKDFPTGQELDAMGRIKALRKLTIIWGGNRSEKSGTNQSASKKLTRSSAFKRENSKAMVPELPQGLEKLDLQCCPETKAPSWLMPDKLKCLKKLYIRGGNLCDLGQDRGVNENVQILRLKYLHELKMDWRELQNAFPNLIYLEKVKCPKLTLFPCDAAGVWLNRKILSKQSLEGLEFTWSFLAVRSS